MLLFSVLQMGARSSRIDPLKCILTNKLGQDWSPEFKKTCLIFCDTEWPKYPLEDGECWPVEGSLNCDTVLQLDNLCRKQGKWVQVTYVLLFFPLPDRPDLCLKGADLGCETFSSPLSSYFAPVSGAPKWTGWESGHTSRRDCLSLGRNSNSPNCSQDYLEDPRST